MRLAKHQRPRAARLTPALALLGLAMLAPLAHTAPVLGFVEHWTGTSLQGWGGGDVYDNPGTGGKLGAADVFLRYMTPGPSPFFSLSLGTTSGGVQYAGDWQGAGITEVRLWINDVGTDEALEMHFAIGNAGSGNFWQYNTGFIPPLNAWAEYTVNLTSAAGFSHIIDSPPGGTFSQALQNVDRLLFRHDQAPYAQSPDPITADVGIDELLLTNTTTAVDPLWPGASGPRPVQLAAPYPNPSRGPLALALEAFEEAPIQVQVVDATGRLIRHVTLAAAPAGRRLWIWDGTTDSGDRAPAGYYRVRAFGPSGGTSRPLVRLGH